MVIVFPPPVQRQQLDRCPSSAGVSRGAPMPLIGYRACRSSRRYRLPDREPSPTAGAQRRQSSRTSAGLLRSRLGRNHRLLPPRCPRRGGGHGRQLDRARSAQRRNILTGGMAEIGCSPTPSAHIARAVGPGVMPVWQRDCVASTSGSTMAASEAVIRQAGWIAETPGRMPADIHSLTSGLFAPELPAPAHSPISPNCT